MDHAVKILASHFRCLLAKEPQSVTSLVPACVTLHNIAQHVTGLTTKDWQAGRIMTTWVIPGTCRQDAVLADLGDPDRGNYANLAAKR